MNKFMSQEIDPEHVWINISKGKKIRAAVLLSIYTEHGCNSINIGVYKLENETISTVNEMIKFAREGENIRFYILEEVNIGQVKEDNE